MNKKFHLMLLVFLLAGFAGHPLSAQTKISKEELKTYYHQFDFWLGEWDVFRYGTETMVGKSHIVSINDSTGILENYKVPKGGYKGKSLNTFNQKTGQWEQYWIDNSGLVLKLAGEFQDGKMVLLGFDGLTGNKISWAPEAPGVRQTWETSSDGGKSWTIAFDGLYLPRQQPGK